MKKFTILYATRNSLHQGPTGHTVYEFEGEDIMQVSDGYHTMDELYEHRITLFIALCRMYAKHYNLEGGKTYNVWRSKLHSDGSEFEGWFVLGINKGKGDQITYHLPLSKWDETNFAENLEKAPEWDGHTSNDVLNRLKNL